MFKPGDRVIRKGFSNCHVVLDEEYTVQDVMLLRSIPAITLVGVLGIYDAPLFSLVKAKSIETLEDLEALYAEV